MVNRTSPAPFRALLQMLVAFCWLAYSALAADPVPGNACSTANRFQLSGGPENSGKVFLMT
jgi:hypothetical protein